MLFTLFELGSIPFWLLLIAFIVLETILYENVKAGAGMIGLVVFVVLLHAFSDFNLIPWVTQHIALTVVYFLSYVAIGLVWSFFRWGIFVQQKTERYVDSRVRYLREKLEIHDATDKTPIPEDKKEDFHRWNDVEVPPRDARKHRRALVSWITGWPFSLGFTLLKDPLRALAHWLVDLFSTYYHSIAARAYKRANVDADMVTKPKPTQSESF